MEIAAIVIVAAVLFLIAVGRAAHARSRRAKVDGNYARRFVWVEDDGSARHVTRDEAEYLNTEFHPGDGARPYIKSNYLERTPDGRIGGFLLRRKLPRAVVIKELSGGHQ
jgi:hypothetical protein